MWCCLGHGFLAIFLDLKVFEGGVYGFVRV